MATILYTQEELDQFVTRASCCASNQAYKALRAAQVKGKNSCEQNKHNYLEMAICALDNYIPVGTVIDPGVSPHAATYACASIDLSGLTGDAIFLGVTLTVNGDDLAPGFANSYYATVDDFGADLLAAANAAIIAGPFDYTVTYYSTSNPTPSLQGRFVICSSIAGDAYNGFPVLFNVNEDRFYVKGQAQTEITGDLSGNYANERINGVSPIYMSYNPLTQEMLGAGNLTNAIGIFNDLGVETGVKDGIDTIGSDPRPTGIGYINIWNPIALEYQDRIVMSNTQATAIAILDSGFNHQTGEGTSGYLGNPGNYSGVVYDLIVDSTNKYIYTACPNAGAGNNKICRWDYGTSGIPDLNNSPAVTWDNGSDGINSPYKMKVHPTTGNIWVMSWVEIGAGVAGEFYEISGGTTLTIRTITGLNASFKPLNFEFIDNSGAIELWIVGKQDPSGLNIAIVELALGYGVAATIDVSGSEIKSIIQHSSGYVFTTAYGSGSFALPNTGIAISPSDRIAVELTQFGAPFETLKQAFDIKEHPITTDIYLGQNGVDGDPGTIDRGAMQVLGFENESIDLSAAFSGGEDEVTEEIPPVIVEEDDGTNCLTQEEAYIIIENIKKICGCCCEFEDDILQKDISSTQ